MKKARVTSISLLSTILFCSGIQAASLGPSSPPPRFSINALTSDYTVGQLDLMLPVEGDNAHNLYVDPNLAYGTDNQGYADLGMGYRWIENQAAILGVYLFGGYSRIANNARLWVINPGVEVMGSSWDMHLNGYVPLGDQHFNIGTQSFLSFSGHTLTSTPFLFNQYAGNGADISLGYQFFPESSIKGYVGSYYFSPPQTENIWGGAAGLEYWPTQQLKVFASYTYDKLNHSTGALGLGVELGRTHIRHNPSLEERITDPVQRYLAQLGRGSAIPSRIRTQALTSEAISVSNIAYFSQLGTPNNAGMGLTLANCTFENPCGPTDFSQTGINTLSGILPNTLMYFNGGSYPALDTVGTGPITLNVGQSLSSRTADYSQPAQGNARSTFNGAFVINTNNHVLNDLIILPTASTSGGNGIHATAGNNITINDVQIGSTANPFFIAYNGDGADSGTINNSELFGRDRAIRGAVNTQLTVNNSSLNINATGGNPIVVSLGTNSNVTINNSLINGAGAAAGSTLSGVGTFQNASITLNNSQINVTATAGNVEGISTSGTGTVTVQQSNIIVDGTTTTGVARGLNLDNSTSTTLTNTSVGVIGKQSQGILITLGTLTLNNSPITLLGTASTISGIQADNTAIVNGLNSDVTVTNTTGSSFALGTTVNGQITMNTGIFNVTGNNMSAIKNGSNIQIINGTCILNGVSIPCP